MPVYDQSYAHWEGTFLRRIFRFSPMVRYEIRLLLSRKLVWLMLVGTMIPAIIASVAVYAISQSGDPMMMMEAFRRSRDIQINFSQLSLNQQYYETARHGFYFFLLGMQSFMVFVIAGIVGGGLISKDIRSNALELYLTKPINALDYVLGKLTVVSVFVFLVTFVPALFVFFVASAMWPGFLEAAWPLLGRILVASVIAAIVNGMVILGLSSLAKSHRYATTAWFALCFISEGAASALVFATQNPNFMFFGFRNNFAIILNQLFGGDVAKELTRQLSIRSDEMITLPSAGPAIVIQLAMIVGASLILRRTIRSVEHR